MKLIWQFSSPNSSSLLSTELIWLTSHSCRDPEIRMSNRLQWPLQFILSQNLKSAQIDQSAISSRLILDLALRWVVSRIPVLSIHPFSTWANTRAERLSLHPPSPPLTHPQTHKLYALKSTNLTRLRCRLSWAQASQVPPSPGHLSASRQATQSLALAADIGP